MPLQCGISINYVYLNRELGGEGGGVSTTGTVP